LAKVRFGLARGLLGFYSARLLNVALRGSALASKFVLIFFLARYLEPSDVGVYGLLMVSISYSLFLVGFEFYTYSTRELIGSDKLIWLRIIRDQVFFYGFTYLAFIPISLLAFFEGWLPLTYLVWFYLLLFLEHVAQEMNRLLVVMEEQLLASVVLFLRAGAWCLISALLMLWFPVFRSLDWVLAAWSVGAGLGCLLGLTHILRLDKTALGCGVNWSWISKGIRIAFPLLIASLAIRGLFTFDKFAVESIAGLDLLGAYVFFIGIATAVVSFVDAGVVVFIYPKIVAAAKKGDGATFKQGMKVLLRDIIFVAVGLIFLGLIIVEPILGWIGRDMYIESFYLLKWLFLAVLIHSLGIVPHVGLYAFGRDKPILYSQLFGFVCFILMIYFGASVYGVLVVPWALCLAFLGILVWKFLAYFIMRKSQVA
jgi:O-antigen/teichoic acid export membrane protein